MIALLVAIVVVGLVVWALNLLPLPEPFKQVILVIGIKESANFNSGIVFIKLSVVAIFLVMPCLMVHRPVTLILPATLCTMVFRCSI